MPALTTNGRPLRLVVVAGGLIPLLATGLRTSIPLYQVPMLQDLG